VAADDSLRCGRGAARVQVAQRVTIIDQALGLAVGGIGDERGELVPGTDGARLPRRIGARSDHDVGDRSGIGTLHRRVDKARQLALDHDAASAGVVEDVADLR